VLPLLPPPNDDADEAEDDEDDEATSLQLFLAAESLPALFFDEECD
jgi:hypothetical protein